MDIFQAVRTLSLPPGQYVVFGSGPLAAHGIRETADVDLFVTTELYQSLKRAGWAEKTQVGGSSCLSIGVYEAYDTWRSGEHFLVPEELIAAAEMINGVPFAPLEYVLSWKKALGRPKDLVDVKLIERHHSCGE
ncbi:hypothetical protein [Allokutzneria albata]|uniref:Nucleotidyltransferase domain-containing protein n=1 Tax=Allokutzneria albata TaxID=211114 RepID=A0A1G9THX1_ALLAB|nr:hypothetical protein [Allokutzneria albata]SDM47270.1 hypothetical protein SAMN04489726_1798 [Allokutzneria albata]